MSLVYLNIKSNILFHANFNKTHQEYSKKRNELIFYTGIRKFIKWNSFPQNPILRIKMR